MTIKSELLSTYGPEICGGWECTVHWYKFEPGVELTKEGFLEFCNEQGFVTTLRGDEGWENGYCNVECSNVYGPGFPEDLTTHQEWAHRQYVKLAVTDLEYQIVHTAHKDIHYGDGYDLTHYHFEVTITEEEFWEFCQKIGNQCRRKDEAAWYEDYGEVKQIDDLTWEHKTVHRYTD